MTKKELAVLGFLVLVVIIPAIWWAVRAGNDRYLADSARYSEPAPKAAADASKFETSKPYDFTHFQKTEMSKCMQVNSNHTGAAGSAAGRRNSEVCIGMYQTDVLRALGLPDKIDQALVSSVETDDYIYGDAILEFENGFLVAVEK